MTEFKKAFSRSVVAPLREKTDLNLFVFY